MVGSVLVFWEVISGETLQGTEGRRKKSSTNKQESKRKKTQPAYGEYMLDKRGKNLSEMEQLPASPLLHVDTTQTHTTIPYRGKRRKMASACRNDNDKGQHFTCSYTTHTEHTPSPHSEYTHHKAVCQIENWFISHKCSHAALYAKWSVQICLSTALLQHRKAHSSPTQHEHKLSLHSQALQHRPAITPLPLPYRIWSH